VTAYDAAALLHRLAPTIEFEQAAWTAPQSPFLPGVGLGGGDSDGPWLPAGFKQLAALNLHRRRPTVMALIGTPVLYRWPAGGWVPGSALA
jgi:hypothetical protein